LYWMLNNHWPSFFGHIFDYYLKPGGAYYGAKKGLRPLSVVFDSYAVGDHSRANFTVVNQTPENRQGLHARIRIYDLNGKVREDKSTAEIKVASGGVAHILELPRRKDLTPVYFVRCELFDNSGARLAENVYWQSTKDDDVGTPNPNEIMAAMKDQQESWADMTALSTMTPVPVEVSATESADDNATHVVIRLKNPTNFVAFFERAEITSAKGGDEILPITYDDNYVTVFPGETIEIHGDVRKTDGTPSWIKLAGYNTAEETVAIGQ